MNLRLQRNALGISQSRLARLSGVSRFKICTYELGGGSLSEDERQRVYAALLAETDRLRSLPGTIELTAPEEVR
jgi:predicted transcriptional regulator